VRAVCTGRGDHRPPCRRRQTPRTCHRSSSRVVIQVRCIAALAWLDRGFTTASGHRQDEPATTASPRRDRNGDGMTSSQGRGTFDCESGLDHMCASSHGQLCTMPHSGPDLITLGPVQSVSNPPRDSSRTSRQAPRHAGPDDTVKALRFRSATRTLFSPPTSCLTPPALLWAKLTTVNGDPRQHTGSRLYDLAPPPASAPAVRSAPGRENGIVKDTVAAGTGIPSRTALPGDGTVCCRTEPIPVQVADSMSRIFPQVCSRAVPARKALDIGPCR